MIENLKITVRDEKGDVTAMDTYGQENKTGKQPFELIEDKINEIIQKLNDLESKT